MRKSHKVAVAGSEGDSREAQSEPGGLTAQAELQLTGTEWIVQTRSPVCCVIYFVIFSGCVQIVIQIFDQLISIITISDTAPVHRSRNRWERKRRTSKKTLLWRME